MQPETLENTNKELVSIRTLANLLDASPATIRDWVFDAKIPYVKMPTGCIRFEVSEIRRWWRRGAVVPVANRLIKV